jgi:uncharacterized protein (TIGR00297 family)
MFTEPLVLTVLVVLIAFLFVVYAYLKRKIDRGAFIATVALGAVIVLTLGYVGVVALLAFFLLGNMVTRYKYAKKEELGVAEGSKGKGMRSINNVFGNGLSPLIFALLLGFSNNPVYLLGFSGAVAAACADTFSTEIGQANGNPRLITTLKKVEVGTNGGVSLPGLGAALLGSGFISLVCLPFINSNIWVVFQSQVQIPIPTKATFFLSCLLAGFLGCLTDSVLGATVEDRKPLRLTKHHVNILATLLGGIFAIELFWFCI